MLTALDARQALMHEHEGLRTLVHDVEELALMAESGLPSQDLALRVRELAIAVRRHSESEEKVLKPFLRDVPALGPLLLSHLNAMHHEEHVEIEMALDLATFVHLPPKDAARHVRAAMRRLLFHMVDEERELMGDFVLNESNGTRGCGG